MARGVAILFCGLIFVFGCGEKKGAAFRVHLASEPATLDPSRAHDLNSVTLAGMLTEGLCRVNKDEKVELALAEWAEVSRDGKTYTFHLREAKWSNGDPVVATDFLAAWKKVLDPSFASSLAFQLYIIKNGQLVKEGKVCPEELGVEVVDLKTLKVTLEEPAPYFLELVAQPIFAPVNPKDEKSGCGPFTLSVWKHDDFLRFIPSETYWDRDHVKMGPIEFIIADDETGFKMFEKKELDWAGSPLSALPVDALAELKKVKVKPICGTSFLRLNTERAPLNSSSIRRALALAIDRKQLVEHVLQGQQIPATGLVPPLLGLQQAPYFQDGDLTRAAHLLSREIDQMPKLKLLYQSSLINHVLCQAIQQQWKEALGIDIELEVSEGKVYYQRLKAKDYDLALGSWIADFNDPINFLSIFKESKAQSNYTGWEDGRFSKLLDKAGKITDLDERRIALSEGEQTLIEAMPIIPIYHYTMLYLARDEIKDVVLTSTGRIEFKWAHLESQGDRQ